MTNLLAQRGMQMPKLGLGTWKLRGDEGRKAVADAIELGYRHIDTARMYDNEAEVGDALRNVGIPREHIHVTTKVWHTELAPDALRRAVETSLRLLQLQYIDLYLIHWPSPGMDLAAALGVMMRLREQGLLRAIGVANFNVALMRQAVEEIGAPIACNQIEYHVGLGQRAVLDYARAHDIAIVAYSPLGRGELAQHPALAAIARRHGATASQVALAWLLAQDGVGAIPKAARQGNQIANLDAMDLTLDDEDRAAIDALPKNGRLVDPGWATCDPA